MSRPSFVTYKDIPISFSAHPKTGNLNILTNADAVKNSIRNIVLTNHFERPFKPQFGGNVTSHLFENALSFTAYEIEKNVREAIENYEPRAIVDRIIVELDPDSNGLNVTIKFRVKNLPEPFDLTVLLERVR